jgi:GT2 family glycosyltransferase
VTSAPSPEELTGRLAILVVNYGSHGLLATNLVAVHLAAPGAQVVVVDNPTTSQERSSVEALCAERGWSLATPATNVGFGSGMNLAAAEVDADVTQLLLLNPDATIQAADLRRLRDHVSSHPGDLVAPTIVTPTGALWSTGVDLLLDSGEMRGWHRRTAEPDLGRVQPWLSGACLLLSRELWERIGGFDDDYFLYWEDVDLSRRVLEAGGQLVVVPEAVAVHDEGATHRGDTPLRAKSATYYYYNVRNRLLFAAKHLDAEQQRTWRRATPRVAYQVLLQGGRRQFRHPSRTFLPAWRGTRDGFRLMRQHRRA